MKKKKMSLGIDSFGMFEPTNTLDQELRKLREEELRKEQLKEQEKQRLEQQKKGKKSIESIGHGNDLNSGLLGVPDSYGMNEIANKI